ncbi:beta-galactosidase [Jeotgalibaca sp. MA1X17-3]|uniref:beta-galactosidase n=1 Tax=Jeotgalibaca sp. MA1X17-3 TaxID=2908211 RepID=UPI001F26BA85|nr:beta-galactosidase [Jeotgalibaca sp. MA1X17-3]UJF15606.1 beta-galactosidase [Jeotgalibaca sp. MA1X17-3]
MLKNHEKVIHGKNKQVILDKAGSEIVLMDSKEVCLQGKNLQNWNYLIITLHNTNTESLTTDLIFSTKNQEEILTVSFSLLPTTKVTVPISLSLLNSQNLFPTRTKGRLRMMVTGKPIRKEEVTKVVLSTRKFHSTRELIIDSIELSNKKEEEIHNPEILIDQWGQWNKKEWDSKISSQNQLEHILKSLLQEAEKFDYKHAEGKGDYYGSSSQQVEATGWFRTEKIDGKWIFVTPDGYPFFSMGIDGINPGTHTGTEFVQPYLGELVNHLDEQAIDNHSVDFGIQNLISVFSKENWWEAWYKITRMYLHKWGMNTIGNWSSQKFIKQVQMPYVIPLDSVGNAPFPSTTEKIFRDFPDVFSEEYSEQAKKYAQNLLPFKKDPFLIGYFMRNEPAWGFVYNLNIAEEMLENPAKSGSKKKFIQKMRGKYSTIQLFNELWKTDYIDFDDLNRPLRKATSYSDKAKEDLEIFSKEMIERYVSVPAEACREVDPHHLNLGMRYAYVADPMMLSGANYFDVFSINSYQLSPNKKMEEIAAIIDKPVMIGEFHFGSIDKGLTATGIRGVLDQKERGVAYRYYMEQAASHPAFVGAHYFMLNDQSCLGRYDGENYQIGFVDICMQEYLSMTEIVKETNKQLYSIHINEKEPTKQKPKEIPAIFC